MPSEYTLYNCYSLQDAMSYIKSSPKPISLCDGQFHIFPNEVLCFFILGKPPVATYFFDPGILVWVTNKPYQDLSGLSPVLPEVLINLWKKTENNSCKMFVKWPNEENFTYVGKAKLTSYGYFDSEKKHGNASFSLNPGLTYEMSLRYRNHTWGRITFECCGNQEKRNGYFELESIKELMPYLQHVSECNSKDSIILDFKGGYIEILTNKTSGIIRCLSENKHSINPSYHGDLEAIEDFAYCGEYEGVPARAVISKTDALRAVELYARTLKLADYVSWAEGVREEIV